ncbi:MAG: 3-phosphoshikimate 1-carboxyvinyltransferase [Christensenellales bacterium]|jgi:3-phosphoshikimate 1-carboxyvinyltransferase
MPDAKIIRGGPKGIVQVPPSKSMGHRAIICGALASKGGRTLIKSPGNSQDIDATLSAMKGLGFRFCREGDDVSAVAYGGKETDEKIDCSESGSTLRFLLPIAAVLGKSVTFTGRGRLMERPLGAYAHIFKKSGVDFSQGEGGARISGKLKSGSYSLAGDVSSQFVSGLLLALPMAFGDSEILLTTPLESKAYVDMTISMMSRFSVSVNSHERGYVIRGGQRYMPVNSCKVEGDYSQAAFFLGASALGRDVSCAGLDENSLQGDRAILRVLEDMGAKITRKDGLISAGAERLRAVTVSAAQIPDLVPPIAALCCFCQGESKIVDAARLRIKESDRLRALAVQLGALGADIEEFEDGLVIRGKEMLKGGSADACNDHRIAMAVALASLRCKEQVRLTGWESVKKSYPNFWADFEKEDV